MTYKICLFITTALLLIQRVNAQEKREFVMSYPIEKRIIVEDIRLFTEQRYNPPAEIQLISDQSEASYDSPEATLIAYFSALLLGDVDWQLNIKTNDDKNEYEKLDTKLRDEEVKQIQKQAAYFIKGRKIVLDKKIAIGDSLTIIEFSIYTREEDKKILSWNMTFFLDNGNWKLCKICGSSGNTLYSLKLNKNYAFKETTKRITEMKVKTAKPTAPFFKFITK